MNIAYRSLHSPVHPISLQRSKPSITCGLTMQSHNDFAALNHQIGFAGSVSLIKLCILFLGMLTFTQCASEPPSLDKLSQYWGERGIMILVAKDSTDRLYHAQITRDGHIQDPSYDFTELLPPRDTIGFNNAQRRWLDGLPMVLPEDGSYPDSLKNIVGNRSIFKLEEVFLPEALGGVNHEIDREANTPKRTPK